MAETDGRGSEADDERARQHQSWVRNDPAQEAVAERNGDGGGDRIEQDRRADRVQRRHPGDQCHQRRPQRRPDGQLLLEEVGQSVAGEDRVRDGPVPDTVVAGRDPLAVRDEHCHERGEGDPRHPSGGIRAAGSFGGHRRSGSTGSGAVARSGTAQQRGAGARFGVIGDGTAAPLAFRHAPSVRLHRAVTQVEGASARSPPILGS